MSFKITQFFYLLTSFLIALFFIAIGFLISLLPWSSFVQEHLYHLLTNHLWMLFIFGVALISVGIALFLYTLFSTKKRYAYIQAGNQSIKIDETLVQNSIEKYWQGQFPYTYIPFQLTLRKHSICIVADLPYMAPESQRQRLEQIKSDFDNLFGRVLGYPHPVHFFASFQKPISQPAKSIKR